MRAIPDRTHHVHSRSAFVAVLALSIAATVKSMSVQTASLVTNIVLAAVTAVYVVLTWRLSRSSDKAAESAAQSAAAAAESARMQQAALEVQASQRHAWFKTGGGGSSYEHWQFDVIPLVGAYWVHSVELLDFRLRSEFDGEAVQTIEFHKDMIPIRGSLPARVDEVDGLRFEINLVEPGCAAFGHDEWLIESWRCLVTFSLAESDQSRRRLVVYLDPSMDPRIHWIQQARELGFEA